ncbi:MAG: tRNA 2-thiouridine(34) synthase MnmA [Lysobacteraceae bacterium]|nr:MAG: tRNA 2-thiouridine(34) synthase MnmA [Xanthomonadaceae bacterium]
MSSPRIIVGMSGGVDSSVAALLLRDQILREHPLCDRESTVAGLFMHNWADDGSGECRAEDDRRDAVAVCGRLGIPIHFRDFSTEYWAGVFEHFLAEYAAGRTPNPDVLCNREIKFKHFLDAARELGAASIATGHYARVREQDGQWQLLRALDRGKDQSYFLHQLGQAQLSATLFPLGELFKSDVRRIAASAGLPTARKKDSTGICFIGERDFREFLARYLPAKPGAIVTPDGRRIGEHPGVFYFTLGQREGLQLGGIRGFEPAPWYVVGKDVLRNELVVDQGVDSPYLYSRRLRTETAHWIAGESPCSRFSCTAQTRYRQNDVDCDVEIRPDGSLEVTFASAQRAVTPGQSLVLYRGEVCLGGAAIAATDAPLDALAHPSMAEPSPSAYPAEPDGQAITNSKTASR